MAYVILRASCLTYLYAILHGQVLMIMSRLFLTIDAYVLQINVELNGTLLVNAGFLTDIFNIILS